MAAPPNATPLAQPRIEHAAGISLMVAAMALFALMDLAIKLAAGHMAQPQVVFFVGLSGFVTFAALALARGERLLVREAAHPAVLARNVVEIVGTCAMIVALGTTPLTVVGAILQATPLAVMAGAALFLKERVGWRRWAAATVGFAGVLVVLKPWEAGIAPGAAIAVLAMLCLSGRDLLNRQAPRALPTLVLAAHALFAILAVGLVWSLAGPGRLLPEAPPWGPIAMMAVFAPGAYFTITASVRAAPVSVVAPFRYSRLLFLAALGIVVLGEQVDLPLIVGSALIIGSGLYALARERSAATALHSDGPAA
ncbi:MAG: DMT family transporter [Paracoccaceae bacterium]|jgi:drug/metabolite transporter (DMT)-like permease|nr:DMT family transporter [Paracoccaceae bacterium]